MVIKAVVFDIGGVLEITSGLSWYKKWQLRTGFTLAELDRQLIARGKDGSLGTCTEEEWISELGKITGFTPGEQAEFMRDLWNWYLGELNETMLQYFVSLRPRLKTALLSNSFVGARVREENKYGLSGITDLIIYSHEESVAKPDPHIYQITCERLEVLPNQVIFVDDNEENVTAAIDFGLHGILFRDSHQTIAKISACIKDSDTCFDILH
jgi:epoxide hydrolase-like predicted phosphatase